MAKKFKEQAQRDTKKSENKYMPTEEQEILLKKLKIMLRKSRIGEDERITIDKRGTKLRDGSFSDNLPSGAAPIDSNIATAMVEKMVDSVTRVKPSPEIFAINNEDENGAQLLQAAVLASWDYMKMQQKLKIAGLCASFSRPGFHYFYWDSEDRNGIGELNCRLILPYQCIVDNTTPFIKDMKFVGFKERMTRARLIMDFPDKADIIEDAGMDSSNSPFKKVENPYDLNNSISYPEQVITKQTVAYTPPAGTSWVNMGKSGDNVSKDPMSEELDVVYLWINDTTPIKKTRIKLNEAGKAIKKLVRHEETGEIHFDVSGYEVVDSPFGPIHQPNLEPKTEDVYEEYYCKKYKFRRHIAFIPKDDIILHDSDWTLPIPLVSQRDNFPLGYTYWSTGLALRLVSLTKARNLILLMLMMKTKYSMAGTYLATNNSGLKQNKLVNKPGEVIYAKKIGPGNIERFPAEPIDPSMFQLLSQIEGDMLKCLNISPVSQGQAVGRADGADTYQKLLEASSDTVVALSMFVEDTILETVKVQMAFIQAYYTHEHMVEIESADGTKTEWQAASSLATRGVYGVKVEIGVANNHSESAMQARALTLMQSGIYSLIEYCKRANVPNWRQALKQIAAIRGNPQNTWLLGAGAAPPATQSKAATQSQQMKRSHKAGK